MQSKDDLAVTICGKCKTEIPSVCTVGANIMFPCEVRTKLRQSSYKVGRHLYELEAKFVRS